MGSKDGVLEGLRREQEILDFKHGNCLAFAISKGLL